MVKKRTAIMALVLMAVSAGLMLSGCGIFVTAKSGGITTKDYEITDFSAVDVGNAFQVDIERGDSYSIQITANTISLDRINVSRSGDTLRIGREWLMGISVGAHNEKVRITMPRLTGLTLSGSAQGTVSGFGSGDDFKARVLDASTLDVDMRTGAFSADVSGASHLNGQITSTKTSVKLSDASRADVDMTTGAFNFQASGSSEGSGRVEATSSTMKLTDASDAGFTGSGGNLDLTATGSSTAALAEFTIGDLRIDLVDGSRADVTVNGPVTGSLSGASQLTYAGNAQLGANFKVSEGSRLQQRH